MSEIEEKMLAEWREINSVMPTPDYLASPVLRETVGLTKASIKRANANKMVTVYRGHRLDNEERNLRIIRLYKEGFSNLQICQMTGFSKGTVTGIISRYRHSKNFNEDSKPLNREDIYLGKNEDWKAPSLETHIIRYNGMENLIRTKHFRVLKALKEADIEYFPTSDLIITYYGSNDVPKTVISCFRKYIKEIRVRIEVLGLTIIKKPYDGYKLIKY